MTGYLWDIRNMEQMGEEKKRHLMEALPASRLAKAEKYRQPEDKERCLGAGILLEYGLAQRGFSSEEVVYGEKGKPFLQRGGCCFNLSHSGDYVVGIFGQKACGVDVQQEKEEYVFLRRACSEREWQWVLEEESAKRAICLWSLKESYGKLTGQGVFGNVAYFEEAIEKGELNEAFEYLHKASVKCSGQENDAISLYWLQHAPAFRHRIHGKSYWFRLYQLAGYSLTVCSEEEPPEICKLTF